MRRWRSVQPRDLRLSETVRGAKKLGLPLRRSTWKEQVGDGKNQILENPSRVVNPRDADVELVARGVEPLLVSQKRKKKKRQCMSASTCSNTKTRKNGIQQPATETLH